MTTVVLPGLTNQVRRESGAWWSTRRWWLQSLVWALLTNALLALVLWVIPGLDAMAGSERMTVTENAVQFTAMAAMLASLGVVVTTQGVLLDERRTGVLEWMLSKPLSRPALLVAKFVGHAGALVTVLVVVPWIGVLAQLSVAIGRVWSPGQWVGAVVLVGLLALFHLALVLALSALTWSRTLVVALPLAGIIGSDLLVANVPAAFDVLPWSLARLAGPVLIDGTVVSAGPIISAVVLSLACLAAAAWGLKRTEL